MVYVPADSDVLTDITYYRACTIQVVLYDFPLQLKTSCDLAFFQEVNVYLLQVLEVQIDIPRAI